MAIEWKDVVSGYSKIGVDWKCTVSAESVTYAPVVYLWYKNNSHDPYVAHSWELRADGTVVSSGSTTFDTGTFSGDKQIDSYSSRTIAKGYNNKTLTLKLSYSDLYGGYGQSWTGSWSGTWTYIVPALESYVVTYNANGGAGAPSSQTKWYGETLKLSSTKPTRAGYTFKGWATSATGAVSYATSANYTANASITLYAVWQANTWAVVYNANGGTGAPSSQTKTYGQTLKLSATKPTRTNYTFKGWGLSSTSTTVAYAAGASYTANAAITLYAIWELAYVPPKITNFTAMRCTSDGTIDDFGTYMNVAFSWACDQTIGANNASAISIQYKVANTTSWTSVTVAATGMAGKVSKTIGEGTINIDEAYIVLVSVTDSKETTTSTKNINASAFTMDFLAGGKGVAFGKPATKENAVEFDFDVYFNKIAYDMYGRRLASTLDSHPIDSVYISFNHTSPASLFGGTWTRISSRFLYAGTSSSTIGTTGGSSTITLTESQIPSHNHPGIYYNSVVKKNAVTLNSGTVSYHVPWGSSSYAGDYGAGNGEAELITGNTGGGGSHNNMPPYITVSIWRRTA